MKYTVLSLIMEYTTVYTNSIPKTPLYYTLIDLPDICGSVRRNIFLRFLSLSVLLLHYPDTSVYSLSTSELSFLRGEFGGLPRSGTDVGLKSELRRSRPFII